VSQFKDKSQTESVSHKYFIIQKMDVSQKRFMFHCINANQKLNKIQENIVPKLRKRYKKFKTWYGEVVVFNFRYYKHKI